MIYNIADVTAKAYEVCEKCRVPVSYDVEVSLSRYPLADQLGVCRGYHGFYRILINPVLMYSELPYALLCSAVMHELLHTCEDTRGHDARWREYARRVSRYWYTVSRDTDLSDFGVTDADFLCAIAGARKTGEYAGIPSFYVPTLLIATADDSRLVGRAEEVLARHGFYSD